MSVATLGRCTFEDSCVPLKGKSEWGMDTLTRKLTGARSLAETFISTLAQGQAYPSTGTNFYYLQTWDADDNPNVATITLNYKGLITGGTPLPDPETHVVTAVGTTSKTFTNENDGLGILYRKDLIWSFVDAVSEVIQTGGKAYRDRYAVSAMMEFTYKTVETRWRYITVGKPFGPRYIFPDINYIPIIQRARITTNDGAVFGRGNWETFFGLTPTVHYIADSHVSRHVIGTPWYECEDNARLVLGDV